MNGNDFLKNLSDIDPQFIDEAQRSIDEKGTHRKKLVSIRKKRILLVAAVLILSLLALPTAAAVSTTFNDALYLISPETAQFFKPVQKCDEDKGVKMEVISAYIHGDTAEIYISLQDTGSNRIDDTTDLFDSYEIRTPFDLKGYCEDVSYDPKTKTKTFLVTLKNNGGQKIRGMKVSFSVSKILSRKIKGTACLEGINLTFAEKNPQIVQREVIGYTHSIEQPNKSLYYNSLEPQGIIASPYKGVSVTALGYIDSKLHIQMHYANVLTTNTCGSVRLKNIVTGEALESTGDFTFWDEERNGHYYEDIFDVSGLTDLQNWKIEAEYFTAPEALEGNWEVTFPLENQEK